MPLSFLDSVGYEKDVIFFFVQPSVTGWLKAVLSTTSEVGDGPGAHFFLDFLIFERV